MSETLLIQTSSMTEFFRDSFQQIARKQKLTVREDTEAYVVNLLTTFLRSDQLFSLAPSGSYRMPMMVELLNTALEAPTVQEQAEGLRRLGDVALFTAAFFMHGMARKLLDVDYYISMGGRAYSTLSESRLPRLRSRREVFGELAGKMVNLVDALGELADTARPPNAADTLRFYEVWLKTGSARAYSRLTAAGITPSLNGGPKRSQ